MKVKNRLKWLPYVIMGYMALAFVWWALVLWRKNDMIFQQEKQLLALNLSRGTGAINMTAFMQTQEYKALEATLHGQRKMIVGEGVFFIVILVIGLYLILRATAKELKNEQARQNFQLSITHELKSPVAAIQLILDTLLQRELPDDKRKGLHLAASKETKRLNDLINDILLAANLEYGWNPNKEPILLNALAEKAVKRIQLQYPEVIVKEHYEMEMNPIQIDKTGMETVFHNLLENAVKYNDSAQKVIEITVKTLTASGQQSITIKDNGKGITDEEKRKVFQKFYRSGAEATRKTKGTGLGLYIVQQVVLAHEGTLTVKDNEPQGTIFRIDLPNPPKA